MALSNVVAIKQHFMRADSITPAGGRKIDMAELKALSMEARAELGPLCRAEMEVDCAKP